MSRNPLDELASLDDVDQTGPINWKKRIRLFAIINFVLAGAMGIENFVQMMSLGKVINTLGISQVYSEGFAIQIFWSLRGIIALAAYLAAGVCLFKEWRWGYHTHIAGCIITTLLGTPICILFIPWTVWGIQWANHEGFRKYLNGERDRIDEVPFVE